MIGSALQPSYLLTLPETLTPISFSFLGPFLFLTTSLTLLFLIFSVADHPLLTFFTTTTLFHDMLLYAVRSTVLQSLNVAARGHRRSSASEGKTSTHTNTHKHTHAYTHTHTHTHTHTLTHKAPVIIHRYALSTSTYILIPTCTCAHVLTVRTGVSG